MKDKAAIWVLLVTLAGLAACSPKTPPVLPAGVTTPTDLPTTKVTPQEGDMVQISSALMPNLSLEDVMRDSEMAFIGTVKEIFPSQLGEPDKRGRKSIYTDVAIVPEKYLFGGSDLSPQIVRVFTGRVGNMTAISEDEPTFTLNERVLVFLSRSSSVASISGNTSSYFRVNSSFLGKYSIEVNTAIQENTNRTEKLARIEALVSSVKR